MDENDPDFVDPATICQLLEKAKKVKPKIKPPNLQKRIIQMHEVIKVLRDQKDMSYPKILEWLRAQGLHGFSEYHVKIALNYKPEVSVDLGENPE